jgi:hypothetical protein
MSDKKIIERYEQESGNYVKDGSVFDDSGHFVCKFTKTLAKNYHENVVDAEDEEWDDER